VYNIVFYTSGGKNPVREFIEGRNKKEIAKILFCTELLSIKGPALMEPYCKKVKGKIYELRVSFAGNALRFFFCWDSCDAVFVHAVEKKT
jgi:hypothetical protein